MRKLYDLKGHNWWELVAIPTLTWINENFILDWLWSDWMSKAKIQRTSVYCSLTRIDAGIQSSNSNTMFQPYLHGITIIIMESVDVKHDKVKEGYQDLKELLRYL